MSHQDRTHTPFCRVKCFIYDALPGGYLFPWNKLTCSPVPQNMNVPCFPFCLGSPFSSKCGFCFHFPEINACFLNPWEGLIYTLRHLVASTRRLGKPSAHLHVYVDFLLRHTLKWNKMAFFTQLALTPFINAREIVPSLLAFMCLRREGDVCLFVWSQPTMFQLCPSGSSWCIPVLSKNYCVLLKDTTH